MKGVELDTTTRDGVLVVTLAGEIDLMNHAEVHEALIGAALDGGPLFVADLNDAHYIDSNGVRMLFGLARELEGSRISWVIALSGDAPLQRLFKVTAFDEVVRIVPSVDDAVAALREGD